MLHAALADSPDTAALVTVMWANNEVGTVQPVADLAEVAHEFGVPFHTDAVQAVGSLPVDFAAAGVDALTMTGHKLGGPVGAGALLLGRHVACEAGAARRRPGARRQVRHAGRARRSRPRHRDRGRGGTSAGARSSRLAALRDRLEAGARLVDSEVVVNGDPGNRLPGISHLSFPGCEGDSLLMLLDARGVECSTGSACSAGVAQPSHVLLAMGASAALARGSLRFSLGHTSTAEDVTVALDALGPAVERARRAGLTSVRA